MTHTTHNKGTCLICGKETQPEMKCTCKFRSTQHTTHNDKAIVEEFSTEWHRLGIPNGVLPQMQNWLHQTLAQARTDQDKISRTEELERVLAELQKEIDGLNTWSKVFENKYDKEEHDFAVFVLNKVIGQLTNATRNNNPV